MGDSRAKILIKAKKLLELAKRGIDGEKEAAQKKLDEHLLKHGIDISEIDDAINIRYFSAGTKDKYMILTNVILSVNPYSKPTYEKGIVKCELDKEDYEEIKNKYKFFFNLWTVERSLLVTAFFTKNNKHFKPDQYAYGKYRDKGQTENPAFKAQEKKNEKINNNVDFDAAKSFNNKETSQQKIDRMNVARLQQMLVIVFDVDYQRGTKV